MAVIARKIYCTKKGKRYGPYPQTEGVYYLYEVRKIKGKVVHRYIGKGAKP